MSRRGLSRHAPKLLHNQHVAKGALDGEGWRDALRNYLPDVGSVDPEPSVSSDPTSLALQFELRELILVGASALELRRKAVDEGMLTLRMSGLRKVQAGVTTIDEVVRETVK